MIIQHPDLGPRDSSEFVYKGDAELLFRPERTENADQEIFHNYLYLRNNPAGKHRELWYHEYGDRSWLVVTRDTTNHEILKVEYVKDYIKSYKAK
jgi:heterotetrameric sarcosine oxidase delta subunit